MTSLYRAVVRSLHALIMGMSVILIFLFNYNCSKNKELVLLFKYF